MLLAVGLRAFYSSQALQAFRNAFQIANFIEHLQALLLHFTCHPTHGYRQGELVRRSKETRPWFAAGAPPTAPVSGASVASSIVLMSFCAECQWLAAYKKSVPL